MEIPIPSLEGEYFTWSKIRRVDLGYFFGVWVGVAWVYT